MSTSIDNMIALIHQCRSLNDDQGRRLSPGTIAQICTQIGLPFLIDPLTQTARSQEQVYRREKAFEQLRSFGSRSGEYYFAEAIKPSIANVVAQKSARARWIDQLIQEGESKDSAIALVVDCWNVAENCAPLNQSRLEGEYQEWLKQQLKLGR